MAEWYEDPNNYLKMLPFIGGVGGTLIGNQYSKSAANMSQDAANKAAARFNPYATIGQENAWNQRNLLNAGPGNYQDYMNTDYYKFPYEQGIKAMERGAAAKGNQLGGRQLKALTAYGQGYAGSKYDEWMANWYKKLQAYQPGINAGLVASGQQASYDALGGMSQAAGQVNQGQNLADLINSIAKYGGDVSTLNELKKLLEKNNGNYTEKFSKTYDYGDGTRTSTDTGYNSGRDVTSTGGNTGFDNILGGDTLSSVAEGGTGLYGADAIYGVGGGPTLTAGADAFTGMYGADALYGIGGDALATGLGAEAFTGLYGADAIYGIGGGLGAGTGTGTGALAGTLAAAAPVAWVAAIAAGIYWAYTKGKAEQIYGLNPFAESQEGIPHHIVSAYDSIGAAPGLDPQEGMKFLTERLPPISVFRARYEAETGKKAPTSTKMLNETAHPLLAWMDKQPEMQQAAQEWNQYLSENYERSDAGDSLQPKGTQQNLINNFSSQGPISYAAHGGMIDEPMMAVGLKTGKKMMMGEAGPEAVVPLGKFNPETEFYKGKKSNRIFDLNTMSWVRR